MGRSGCPEVFVDASHQDLVQALATLGFNKGNVSTSLRPCTRTGVLSLIRGAPMQTRLPRWLIVIGLVFFFSCPAAGARPAHTTRVLVQEALAQWLAEET
jgi:hypothetical protein